MLSDWTERITALRAVSPEVAEATEGFAVALAGAADAGAIQTVRNAGLSRENGAFTEALALVPSLSVEEKRVLGQIGRAHV